MSYWNGSKNGRNKRLVLWYHASEHIRCSNEIIGIKTETSLWAQTCEICKWHLCFNKALCSRNRKFAITYALMHCYILVKHNMYCIWVTLHMYIWLATKLQKLIYWLTLKVLNFWKFTSYCNLKPLWSGMGEVVPARTLPTVHPPSPPTVHQLSWLAL